MRTLFPYYPPFPMPSKKKNAMQRWIQQATIQERQRLADMAGTTTGHLMQIAGGYRTEGKASTTPALAAAIEKASSILAKANPELSVIPREELCPACKACSLAKKARKC